VAKETRKLKRAAGRQGDEGSSKAALKQPLVTRPQIDPKALGREQIKGLLWRLGIPLAAIWFIGIVIAGFSQSPTVHRIALGLPAVLTVLLSGLVVWALRQANKARGVAGILSQVETADDRKAAIERLEAGFKKKDPAAIFAKAQLELHEDPNKALATLEQIDLKKVMAPVADEARAQRAMIHLMQGQVAPARQLADGIDVKRHQEAKTRAMLASVVAESWARSGQAKKGLEVLEVYDPEDAEYEQLRPQLFRAYAFAYAYTNDHKGMRRALRKLLEQDPRLLGAFLLKKTHPLLQKEAKKLLEQSGAVPRKMMVQRR
jgi:hypothetical protein